MSLFLRKRLVWLAVFMVWVGMVSSVVVYQSNNGNLIRETVTGERAAEGPAEVEEQDFQQLAMEVGEELEEEEDFFIEFRLERDRSRSKQLGLLQEIIDNPETDERVREESQERLIAITERMEKEVEVENLIRVRGFDDALVFIHNQSADIIVLTLEPLVEEEVAQVADVASRVTGISLQEITILERLSS